VLIQHLDTKHQSLMVDLLIGHTKMKVLEAIDGVRLERDHAYLIPPQTKNESNFYNGCERPESPIL
jgi:two-component system, chemotaxis family, CheB/CheR fusion protein